MAPVKLMHYPRALGLDNQPLSELAADGYLEWDRGF